LGKTSAKPTLRQSAETNRCHPVLPHPSMAGLSPHPGQWAQTVTPQSYLPSGAHSPDTSYDQPPKVSQRVSVVPRNLLYRHTISSQIDTIQSVFVLFSGMWTPSLRLGLCCSPRYLAPAGIPICDSWLMMRHFAPRHRRAFHFRSRATLGDPLVGPITYRSEAKSPAASQCGVVRVNSN